MLWKVKVDQELGADTGSVLFNFVYVNLSAKKNLCHALPVAKPTLCDFRDKGEKCGNAGWGDVELSVALWNLGHMWRACVLDVLVKMYIWITSSIYIVHTNQEAIFKNTLYWTISQVLGSYIEICDFIEGLEFRSTYPHTNTHTHTMVCKCAISNLKQTLITTHKSWSRFTCQR